MLFFAAVVVFAVSVAAGLHLAKKKLLWNDEIFSHVQTLERLSYADIFLSRIHQKNNLEPNVAPLFYLIQKGVCDVAGYRFTHVWEQEPVLKDPRGQIVLRIGPVIFMSLAVSIIFYFFSRDYSLGLGLYALAVTLSSVMVWALWAEARPYPLWFLLTTIQLVLTLRILMAPGRGTGLFYRLTAVHFLLIFTAIVSIIQVGIVSLVLWVRGHRRWQDYLGLVVFPVAVCFYYYLHTPRFTLGFPPDVWRFIFDVFPPGWMGVILIYMLWRAGEGAVLKRSLNPDGYDTSRIAVLGLMGLILFSGPVLMFVFNAPGAQFFIDKRFFTYLVPMMIFAVVIFSSDLFHQFKGDRWMQWNAVIVLGGLALVQALRTFLRVTELAVYN